MYSFVKKKQIGIKKPMIYELKTILETKKIRVDCIDKANAIYIKTFQIKLAKVVTFNERKGGDKGGKSKRQNAQLAQSEFHSFAFFFSLILFSKFLSLH
jgi:hypothetical protein